ncbi:HXXEE domain-containing protein [Mycolicibacterium septicum]|uniref:HXXEE domain-containing protein n=1 Tax=Mycolicibacterium septicum TaxID=98668 RepID=UPI0023609EA4|nr:HXXEE domain-containing protein [Mycolicibacterium septicum]
MSTQPKSTGRTKLLDTYRREWPRVAAVQAMVLGGASILAGRRSLTNLRALSVMNAMTMCVHQYEEYVDPGWFPGMINVGWFKSDKPYTYPFNTHSAMCANISFRALYVPAMLFPKVKWLGLPPVLLGIGQAVAHGAIMPRVFHLKYPYTPGTLSSVLLHVPIGINYLSALRAQGPIGRSNWIKSAVVLALFFAIGVALPNVRGADKNSTYAFTDQQMGPYLAAAQAAATDSGDTSDPTE